MPDIFDATKVKPARKSANEGVVAETPTISEPDPSVSVETAPEFIDPGSEPSFVQEDPSQAQPAEDPKKGRNYDRPHREVDEYSELMRQETPSANPFQAFAAKPLQVFFDTQDKAERVILLLRKSPITQIPWLVITIFLLFMPFLFGSVGLLGFLPLRFQLAGFIFWYLLVAGFVLESFLSWFFNVYIITDERVIDVDFLSLIYKNISAAKIDNIEDVTAVTGGAIRSLFDFGTVKIQTAGSNTEIEFEDVPQPGKVTRLLNELLLEEEKEKIEGRVN